MLVTRGRLELTIGCVKGTYPSTFRRPRQVTRRFKHQRVVMDLNHLKFSYNKNLLTNLLIAEIVFNLIPCLSKVSLVAQDGVEPPSSDNDSEMLPLHYRAIKLSFYSGGSIAKPYPRPIPQCHPNNPQAGSSQSLSIRITTKSVREFIMLTHNVKSIFYTACCRGQHVCSRDVIDFTLTCNIKLLFYHDQV